MELSKQNNLHHFDNGYLVNSKYALSIQAKSSF